MIDQVIYDDMGMSGRLRVIDRRGRRTLYLGCFPQTTIDVQQPDRMVGPYIPYLLLGALFSPQPRQALFLGVGGGAVVRSYARLFESCSLTAVDIDPMVIEVARDYFFLPQSDRLDVQVADGRDFVLHRTCTYDHIVLDVYNQDGYPPRMYSQESLVAMKKALRSRHEGDECCPGVLVINAVGFLNGDQSETLRIVLRTVQSVFEQVYLFEVQRSWWSRIWMGGNNFIVVATQTPGEGGWSQIKRRAQALDRAQSDLSFQALLKGWRRIPSLTEVEVLTDDRIRQGEMLLTI